MAIGRSSAPNRPAAAAPRPVPWTSPGRRANGSDGGNRPATTSTSVSRVASPAAGGAAGRRRAVGRGAASVAAISPIGVMPAIASRAKDPSAYETAPTRRSSM